MKNILLLSIICIFALVGCKQEKHVKTIENLKAAINGELTASARYSSFAVKAETNHPEIARLFNAASKSEAIHAANHLKVLKSIGEKPDEFILEINVNTTLENLQKSIQEETSEIDYMYPKFIADAVAEKGDKAVESFTWALDTEKKHLEFFKRAITSVFEKIDRVEATGTPLPGGYLVCPVCGNIYDNKITVGKCEFCFTDQGKFLSF
ncbi:MAG: ferritin family protein [Bacteroidales bacterium]|jgi:rubrerythrin